MSENPLTTAVGQVAALLADVRERGEAASWVVYPPSPRWWPFLFGVWTFAYALALGLLEGLTQAAAEALRDTLIQVAETRRTGL